MIPIVVPAIGCNVSLQSPLLGERERKRDLSKVFAEIVSQLSAVANVYLESSTRGIPTISRSHREARELVALFRLLTFVRFSFVGRHCREEREIRETEIIDRHW